MNLPSNSPKGARVQGCTAPPPPLRHRVPAQSLPHKWDYRDFRTPECIAYAMIHYCDARNRGASLRGKCPRPECHSHTDDSLRTSREVPIAYCRICNNTWDAIEIIKRMKGVTAWAACEEMCPLVFYVDDRAGQG